MLDTVDFNHVQHISFTQSRLTDAVSVILSELLSYEHPPNVIVFFFSFPVLSGPETLVFTAFLIGAKHMNSDRPIRRACRFI